MVGSATSSPPLVAFLDGRGRVSPRLAPRRGSTLPHPADRAGVREHGLRESVGACEHVAVSEANTPSIDPGHDLTPNLYCLIFALPSAEKAERRRQGECNLNPGHAEPEPHGAPGR